MMREGSDSEELVSFGPVPCPSLDATLLDAPWARKVENVSALVA